MEKVFSATIVDRKEVAKDAYEAVFELDCENFDFTPGQYIWVVLPELKYPDDRGNRRAFSIVSSSKDKKNQIRCVFRKSGSGFKQTLIEMPIGSAVRIDGPFGFCTLPQEEAVPAVFLVGGVGIASVFTMVSYATMHKSSRQMILIYANSNPERTVYLDELKDLQRENKNLILVPHVGDLTPELIFNNTRGMVNPIWYIFGPEAMVLGVGEMLARNNIQLDKIETEEFRIVNTTFYKENREAIKTSDNFKKALDNAFNHIIVTDPEGVIVYANHGAEIITGYSIKEMLGNTPRLWGGLMTADFYSSLWKTIKKDLKVFEGEFMNRKKSGVIYFARSKISPFFNPKNNNLIGFVGAEEDITKEKEMEKLRTDFLSLASHQLRTPLSGTKWLIETLNQNILGPVTKKQKEYLDQIYQINERMIKLVFDMLNVLSLESSGAAARKEEVSMLRLYDEVTLMMEPAAKSKEVTLRNALRDHKEITIDTDIQMLRNILECFVSNAINYSSSGQEVVLDAEEEEAASIFSVRDSGIGIPREEQKLIFGRFYRASNAKMFKPEGTGLGLYIASMLTEKIGGEVSFESEEGKGSTFYLRIPKTVEKIA